MTSECVGWAGAFPGLVAGDSCIGLGDYCCVELLVVFVCSADEFCDLQTGMGYHLPKPEYWYKSQAQFL